MLKIAAIDDERRRDPVHPRTTEQQRGDREEGRHKKAGE